MDIIEKLIKHLEEAKAELSKNVNASYSSDMNISKDEEDSKVNLNNPYNDQSSNKESKKKDSKLDLADPNQPYGSLKKDAANPALAPKEVKIKKLQAQIDSGTYKPDASKIADKMLQKEELSCSENGQWNLKIK